MGIIRKSNQTIIEFGTGDIIICSGMIKGDAVLGLNIQEFKEIGSRIASSETAESLPNSEVYITFGSIKSLETLILKLQEARSIVVNDNIVYDLSKIENITTIYEPNKFLKG